ncbi:MAG: hypothetical protein FWD71_03420 [Oscillospiraceae bacterium]|nr:hypothetical protein [Oscillospiraceae bacterium]
MKKNFKLKLIALFLCAVLLVPMTFACGKSGDTGSTTAADTAPADTTPAPTTIPPTTPVPTTTAEPTTPAPTEPIDPNLPYWQQIQIELSNNGLKNGVQILPGTDEADLMKKLSANSCTRAVLDVSKDNVPFTAAYSYTVSKDPTNWWDVNCSMNCMKDVPVQNGDLVVGVLWVKGVRNPGSALAADTDPPEYYLALKTPTDSWATEGEMSPTGNQFLDPSTSNTWQKVWFSARVLNDETQSSNLSFQIFMGFGFQEIDIGGLIAYYFPSTPDNEKAVINLTY